MKWFPLFLLYQALVLLVYAPFFDPDPGFVALFLVFPVLAFAAVWSYSWFRLVGIKFLYIEFFDVPRIVTSARILRPTLFQTLRGPWVWVIKGRLRTSTSPAELWRILCENRQLTIAGMEASLVFIAYVFWFLYTHVSPQQ